MSFIEGDVEMNLKTWQQLSEIKSNILYLVKVLLNDSLTRRETIAFDILQNVELVNCLEESFREGTIKSHQILTKLAYEPFYDLKAEEREAINFTQWQLLSLLKSMLLSNTYSLLEEPSVSRGKVASSLMANVYCLNQIEKECIEQLKKTEFIRIAEILDKAESCSENN
jgi:hypothetical protein